MATSYDPKDKIWRGPKLELKGDSSNNVAERMLNILTKDPDHIAQICYTSRKEFTNREMVEMSMRVARHFQDHLKMSQGEIIGICAFNSDYVVPLFYGGLLVGLVVNPIDPRFDKEGIKYAFSLTKPSIMFCDGDMYSIIKTVVDELHLAITIYTMKSHIPNIPTILEFLQERYNMDTFKPNALKEGGNQTALLLCSSGTTGQPKAVSMSHAYFTDIHTIDSTIKSGICFSSLHWFSGIMMVLVSTRQNVTCIISERPFSTNDFFAIVEKYKVGVFLAPPYQLALLGAALQIRNCDLSSIKAVYGGGSALPMAVIEKLKPYLPNAQFHVVYALTEGARCSFGLADKENCVGSLVANVEVKILDNNGQQLGPNEQGEICMKPPFPWAGYYNNPAATAATLIDDWIHTGDIGYFDDDNYLFVVDRKKDILKYNNFQVSPLEIEAVIYKMNGVTDTCVFGIPDSLGNDLLAAAVVLIPGCQLTDKEITDHVAVHVADYQRLRGGVYFLDGLPRSSNGKLLRREVSNICHEMRRKL